MCCTFRIFEIGIITVLHIIVNIYRILRKVLGMSAQFKQKVNSIHYHNYLPIYVEEVDVIWKSSIDSRETTENSFKKS